MELTVNEKKKILETIRDEFDPDAKPEKLVFVEEENMNKRGFSVEGIDFILSQRFGMFTNYVEERYFVKWKRTNS